MEHYLQLGNEAWDRAAASAYRLERFLYRDECLELRLLRSGRGQPWVSSPYGYVGGVDGLNASNSVGLAEVLHELLGRSGAPYALLRTIQALPETIADQFKIDTGFHTFFLNLDGGSERVWKSRLASKVRRQTRRGFRMGLEAKVGRLELFHDFFAVISRCWRDLGTPLHKASFFKALLENYGERNSAIINLYSGSQPVSSALLLIRNDVVYHPFTGTIRHFQTEGGNNVLYWRIIEWACDRGYRWFDMGRSQADHPVARYKRPWGAEEMPLYYNYLMAPGARVQDLDAPWVKLAVRAWKEIPVWASARLGPFFIRSVV